MEPAKLKHEKSILLETWNAHGAAVVWAELSKRPLVAKPIVLYKTLVLLHKMVRDGHPRCAEDLRERAGLLEALMSQMQQQQTSASGLETLNAAYLSFMLTRLKFHGLYPDVGVTLSLEKYQENTKGKRIKDVKRLCVFFFSVFDKSFHQGLGGACHGYAEERPLSWQQDP